MLRRGVEVAVRGRNPARDDHDTRRTQSVGGSRQAWPNAIVANSPAGTTAAAREKKDGLQRRLAYKHRELEAYRQQAEDFKNKLNLVTDQLEAEKLASDGLDAELQGKTNALAVSQAINAATKHVVAKLRQELAGSTARSHEPARGAEFLDRLFPEKATGGPPRVMGMRIQWFPGMVREIFRWKKSNACACMREVAANGLTNLEQRYADTVTLGEGGNGIVRRGRCTKTRKVYAIKTMREGVSRTALVREMVFYAITGTHKNLIEVACVNDIAGSEGLLMEVAVCDLHQACTKNSDPEFNLEQLINFEADATEGLSFMHGNGVVHCDHKLANILICRSDGLGRFVGKVTDPGVWCGLGETRDIKWGTPGRVPLENVLSAVPAAPDQDLFAAAVDVCYIVLKPALKTANDNVWTLSILATPEEKARALVLHAEGGNLEQHWADIGQRTMTDGTLARVLLQPQCLNQTLPPSELHNVCEVLRKALSPNPVDRPDIPFFTRFLRDLATNTTAYVEALVATLAGVSHPPLLEHPPVEAPIIVPAPRSPAARLVRVGGDRSGDAAGAPPMEQVHLAPPLVGATHPEGDNHDVAAAVAPADAARVGNSSAPPAVDRSAEAADAASPIMPFVEVIAAGVPDMERVHPAPPLVRASHPEGDIHDMAAAVPPAEASYKDNISVSRGSALPAIDPPVETEAANPVMPFVEVITAGVPSMERVHLAPPLVGAPHPLGDANGAVAAVPPVEAACVDNSSAPRGSAPPAIEPSAEAAVAANPVMSLVEVIAPGVPYLERVHLATPPVVASHPEGDDNDVAAALPQANDTEAGSGLTPRGSAPPISGRSLEEINECVDPLLQPFPVLPAEVLANHIAKNLRSLRLPGRKANVPPPVAARPLPGQPYRGDGGDSGDGNGDPLFQPLPVSSAEVMANHVAKTLRSLGGGLGIAKAPPPVAARPLPGQAYRFRGGGSGGGGDSGGGRGGGGGGRGSRGRAAMRGASRGMLPGNTRVKGRGFFIPSSSPSRTAECSFWARFWQQKSRAPFFV